MSAAITPEALDCPMRIGFDEARALLRERLLPRRLGIETVPLAECAGRVLAGALHASGDVPGFAHSAMDGYAVRGADLAPDRPTRLRLAGVALAGGAAVAAPPPGCCVRITTGAALPPGTDTVVIREHAQAQGEWIELQPGTPAGGNTRGADDDWRRGDEVLPAGRLLDAGAVAVAASLGEARLRVRRRPRVGLVVTGDELVEVGAPRGHGQRYDSNAWLLGALVRALGGVVVATERVRDDAAALEAAVRAGAARSDLVISSGGVSAGEADLLPGVLARAGTPWLWKVRMRPGMPVLFGEVDGTPLAALPGNPVSVYATFRLLVQPLLAQLYGCAALDPPPWHARLATPLDKRHDRTEFRRGTLHGAADGSLQVTLHPQAGSGALRSVVQSDVLVEFAAPPRHHAAGEVLPVHPMAVTA